jgi:membrane protease YdiL (CAAX protease family)
MNDQHAGEADGFARVRFGRPPRRLLSSTDRGAAAAGSHVRGIRMTRRVRFLELALVLGALVMLLWVVPNRALVPKPLRPLGQILTALVVATVLFRQRPGLSELGLAPPRWFGGLLSLGCFTALGTVGLILIGQPRIVSHPGDEPWRWLLGNLPVQWAQQVLLQVIVAPRVAELLGVGVNGNRLGDSARPGPGSPLGSVISGTLFGLLHLPNPPLTALTLVSGIVWAEWFRRHRHLPALLVSHAILGLTAWSFHANPWMNDMRVGLSWFPR